MTTQELLERLQLLDETERIGAKAGSDAGKSDMETVCAFANEPGMVGGKYGAGELTAQGAGGAALSSNPSGLTSNPQGLSSSLAGVTSHSESLDSNPASRSDPLSDPRRQALLNELPGGLAARVGAIGRRHPPDEVKDLVVTLCELRAWKAETVRQDYLRPLLRAGRITMTRPDKPNDPDQAYRASTAK